MASANGHVEIAKILIQNQIEINYQNESGSTALRKELVI